MYVYKKCISGHFLNYLETHTILQSGKKTHFDARSEQDIVSGPSDF